MKTEYKLSQFFAGALPGATMTSVLLEICKRDPDFLYDCVTTVENPTWSQRAEILLRAQRKIEAIKICREATGWSLKEAKDAVESLQKELGI